MVTFCNTSRHLPTDVHLTNVPGGRGFTNEIVDLELHTHLNAILIPVQLASYPTEHVSGTCIAHTTA